MGIPVTGTITTTDASDTYPTHDSSLGKGGHRTVATVTEMNNIPTERRVEGMLVYVVATTETYKLLANLTTWELFTPMLWTQQDW